MICATAIILLPTSAGVPEACDAAGAWVQADDGGGSHRQDLGADVRAALGR